jgi:putative phosphoribosyl transferase
MFKDRRHAGRLLAERLDALAAERPVVLALPRGGVPVAYEVAARLDAPLDVLVVRKLGAPDHPELGIGALAEGGSGVLDQEAVAALRVGRDELDALVATERTELARRVRTYRGDRPRIPVAGRTVILVDDGLATGGTARAAVAAVAAGKPARLVVAVPVGAPGAADRLAATAGVEVVVLAEPPDFHAVGAWYECFDQTSDEEVLDLLRVAAVR